MRYLFFLFLILQLNMIVNAQLPEKKGNHMTQDSINNYNLIEYAKQLKADDYYKLLDSIKNKQSRDFLKLRLAYTRTKAFSPYDHSIIDLHDSIRVNYSEKQLKTALNFALRILKKNFVDLITHYYCSQIYYEMNDIEKSQYHYDIFQGLLQSIIETGDGKSPETAFIVINAQEEYLVLEVFGLESIGQSLETHDGHRFDVLQVKDPKNNSLVDVYYNIDLFYGKF